VKHLCIADSKRRILYASRHYPGKIHDKTVFEEESREKKLPKRIKKLFDLAFLGLENEHENVVMPKKKPKGGELTASQKARNRRISRVRVKIENAFAGVKRLRIVYNVSRTRKDDLINLSFLIACGIWNFYMAAR
jgi:hypothetical protein